MTNKIRTLNDEGKLTFQQPELLSFLAYVERPVLIEDLTLLHFNIQGLIQPLQELNVVEVEGGSAQLAAGIAAQVQEELGADLDSIERFYIPSLANEFYIDPEDDNSHLNSLAALAEGIVLKAERGSEALMSLANNLVNFFVTEQAFERALVMLDKSDEWMSDQNLPVMYFVSALYNRYQIQLGLGRPNDAAEALKEALAKLESEGMQESNEYQTLNSYLQAL